MVPRTRLSRADWIDAALSALADGGLVALAVEPLAARLGVTKGSFYSHFASRDELVEATLGRWVASHGRPMFEQLDALPEPSERLRVLFESAVAFAQSDAPSVHVRLLRETHDPRVRAALQHVNDERMAWLADLFAALGHDRAAARRRARISYAAFIGLLQMARDDAGSRLDPAETGAFTAELVRVLQR